MATVAPTAVTIPIHQVPPQWLTVLDTVVHDAVNVESLIAGLLSAFVPGAALFIPEVEAFIGVIAAALDKAVAAQTK